MTDVRLTTTGARGGSLEVDGHDITAAVVGFHLSWPHPDAGGTGTRRPLLVVEVLVDHLDADLRDVVVDLERHHQAEPTDTHAEPT